MSRDLKLSITVKQSPEEVYHAINDVKAWWIGEVKGDAEKVGSEFTYRYKDFHTSLQKVVELSPNKIVWQVEEATLGFTKDKEEWNGTNLIFEIVPKGDETEIRFIHQGLTPALECFDACSGGWDFYITKSLKNLLLNGEGLDPGF